jgi:hypothetical protein
MKSKIRNSKVQIRAEPDASATRLMGVWFLVLKSLRRATSECATSNNPEYFPIYFKTVNISRVSFKDHKDGKF